MRGETLLIHISEPDLDDDSELVERIVLSDSEGEILYPGFLIC